jgi:hypothetical protein
MEHFVRVILEKDQGPTLLDESVFPAQTLLETTDGDPVIEIPLNRELTNEEADEFAERLMNYMTEQGHTNFDIEISGEGE